VTVTLNGPWPKDPAGNNLVAYTSGDFTISPDVTPLGPIDFMDLQAQNPSLDELYYSLQTTHNGVLSLEASDPDVQLSLLDQSFAYLGSSALVDAHQRLDWSVNAGETYLVRLAGTATDVDLRLVNLVRQSGTELTVSGTTGADAFLFDASAGIRVEINEVAYQFAAGQLIRISFNGGGNDTAVLQGSTQTENARIWPNKARFMATGLDVWVYDTETITAHSGGGSDTVRLFDSSGTDTFSSDPQSATMVGEGFSNTAEGFRYVYGISGTGGADTAYLYDSDKKDTLQADAINVTLSGGNDYLEASGTWAKLSGLDIPYSILVDGFNPVTAKSSNTGDKKHESVDFLIATGYWEDV
jgi:hypothetical protein